MSNVDPIDEYLNKKFAAQPRSQDTDPIEEYLNSRRDIPQVDEESKSAWREFLDGVNRTAETINAYLPLGAFQEGAAERRTAVGAGIIQGALIDPLTAIAGIPGDLGLTNNVTDKAKNFLERSKLNLFTFAEKRALDAGVPVEEIHNAYGVGNFIGFTVPLEASIKTASVLLKAPIEAAGLGGYAKTGALVTDLTAGAVYGATFKPADSFRERVQNTLHESAMFGVARLMLTPFTHTIIPYRLNRTRDLAARDEVNAAIERMMNRDTPIVDTEPQGIGLMQLLSEEHYLSSSPAAQDILARRQDESSLVQAILDVHRAKGSGGKIRFQRPIDEVSEIVSKFKEEFPNLKFDVVSRPGSKIVQSGDEQVVERVPAYEVTFGTKGLSNVQRAELKNRGRFTGQKFYRNGAEFTYLGDGNRPEYVRLKRTDGTETQMKLKNLTELPVFEEDVSKSFGGADELFQDFKEYLDRGGREIASISGALPEADIIRGIESGKIVLDDNSRRAFDVGGAIIYPDELGLKAGEEGISGIRLAQAGVPRDEALLMNVSKNTVTGEGPWVAYTLTSDGVPIERQAFNSIEEALQAAANLKFEPSEVVHNFVTAQGTSLSLVREGVEYANLLEPPSVMTFEKLFDSWVRDRGITLTEDLPAARANFANRYRSELWSKVSDRDKEIFNRVRQQLDKLVDEGKVPFEALAHNRGFHTKRLPGGKLELRDIDTGMKFMFGSELVAADAIKAVDRSGEHFFGADWLDSNGLAAFSGGFRNPGGDDWSNFIGGELFTNDTLIKIPSNILRNTRDWLIAVEELTGIPLFSRGFNLVDEGVTRMRGRYEPWSKAIQDAWKGLEYKEKLPVVEFWRSIEGSTIPMSDALRLGKEAGLSAKQLRAFQRSRAIWDEGYKMAGLPSGRYIEHYYGRVRQWVEDNNTFADLKRIFGSEGVPPEFQFFAEMQRTGEMPTVEMDPEIVMHKWFRGMFFNQEVKPHWDKLAELVETGNGKYKRPPMRIKDLPQDKIQEILRANPQVSLNDPVLSDPIRSTLAEYLTIVRGNPGAGLEKLRWFNKKLNESLGIQSDDRVVEEFYNIWISSMYGAAMAARPSVIARNQTQTIWNLWTRLGGRFSNAAMAKAITQEGFEAALRDGAIRSAEAGIPYGDAIFRNREATRILIGKKGPMSMALAATARKLLRSGHLSQSVAEKLLVPYSSGEQVSRSWAYWWQRLHTERYLDQFETRRIGWEKFEEKALPFYSNTVKNTFRDLYRVEGREKALGYIGKMAADETHFIYGVGASPAWMQKPVGRLVGMFGTWPMWAIELYGRRVGKGTALQQAAFWARTLTLTGAFANMSIQSGVDMWNWINPLGIFGWSGGPVVDAAVNAKRTIDAPMDQKAAALQRTAESFGKLALPGQMFFHDLSEAGKQVSPLDAWTRLMMGKHYDQDSFAMKFMYGDWPNEIQFLNPDTESAIDSSSLESVDLGDGTVPFLPLPNH